MGTMEWMGRQKRSPTWHLLTTCAKPLPPSLHRPQYQPAALGIPRKVRVPAWVEGWWPPISLASDQRPLPRHLQANQASSSRSSQQHSGSRSRHGVKSRGPPAFPVSSVTVTTWSSGRCPKGRRSSPAMCPPSARRAPGRPHLLMTNWMLLLASRILRSLAMPKQLGLRREMPSGNPTTNSSSGCIRNLE